MQASVILKETENKCTVLKSVLFCGNTRDGSIHDDVFIND
jgi:hypothetical protein